MSASDGEAAAQVLVVLVAAGIWWFDDAQGAAIALMAVLLARALVHVLQRATDAPPVDGP
jgi:hypothetical protein